MEPLYKDDTPITKLPYSETGYFSPLIVDYLDGKEELSEFYNCPPQLSHFKKIIADKANSAIQREVLVKSLKTQYKSVESSEEVHKNIDLLAKKTTFTITTAHQPCLFTGPLYVIYKILSTINLTKQLKSSYPEYDFIPIYWMGSEDHDFEEINHIHAFEKKIVWKNTEHGAVGRMSTKAIHKAIQSIEECGLGSPHQEMVIELLRNVYSGKTNFAMATFRLMNGIFQDQGLVVIEPDNGVLKDLFKNVVKEELSKQHSYHIVNQTIIELSKNYKIQAKPREINLFYLKDGLRERIIKTPSGSFEVNNTDITLTKDEILVEVENHPERFSPNVTLRGLYQEMILPNLAYIGGGGELAYWMEHKKLFEHYGVNFPMLILRNSLLLIQEATQKQLEELSLSPESLFENEEILIKEFIKKRSTLQLDLSPEKQRINDIFSDIIPQIKSSDPSLENTARAEQKKLLKTLKKLEGKLMKAEKKNYEFEMIKIKGIKSALFPKRVLQERVENIIPYLLLFGNQFLRKLIPLTDPLSGEFLIVLLTSLNKTE